MRTPISTERGMAMVTTLLVLMLISALLVGFTTVVISDQRYRFIDRDRGQAFYAASGAVEKLTADLGNTFFANVAPTAAQVNAIVAVGSQPSITGVTFTAATAPQTVPGSTLNASSCSGLTSIRTIGSLGYNLTFCADATGNPTTIQPPSPIKTGPYEGLVALQAPYQIDVTAKTATGGEVHLTRTIESVAIPVFQFGTFSDVDLSFFAGPNFNFGGRVHSNGSLFLAQGTGATLTLAGKVTSVKEVVRQRLQNGVSIDTAPAHAGIVSMATSATAFRNLDRTEGSVVDTVGPGQVLNDPTWHNVSLSAYNSWIRNGRTGAKQLNLPLLTVGGTNPDLIRRPPQGENAANPVLYNERLYSKASLRILLSDRAVDITNLPTVTAVPAPVQLDNDWTVVGNRPAGYPLDAAHPPIARSMGPIAATTTTAVTNVGDTTITVNAMPLMFQRPQVSVKTAGGVYVSTFTCTTWNETTIAGCNVPVALATGSTLYIKAPPVGSTVAVVSNMPGQTVPPTATLNGNVAIGNPKTLALNAGQNTWGFAANTFWLNDVGAGGTGTSTVITCTGANGNQFTGCSGVPATRIGATVTTGYASNANTGTIGGFIKIERQDPNGAWWDVTAEILNYGIGAPNYDGVNCGDPSPNAILRIQRLRDNSVTAGGCPNANTVNSYDYWPNVLFDTREGLPRDVAPATASVPLGGVMYYISLDVANLSRWFTAAAPFNLGTGANSKKDNGGFTVYFSDRRNNRKADSTESGEYGYEDFVNPLSATGAPNGLLDVGEDVNASGTLDVYGGVANANGVANSVPFGIAPLTAALATPIATVLPSIAEVNRAVLFRHALKLVNGNNITGLGVTGLSVVSENPVYIQGDWNSFNAGASNFAGPSAATAVMADAVTLLSGSWDDANSFTNPYNPAARARTNQSWYRLAIIGGKGAAFPWPNGTPTDFGTDGGAHNFLRYLEDGGFPVNYMGATATFFYNRQAVGTYKCCTTVYQAPARNYNFDINFNNPALLPPNTPVFRDMNSVGFSQELRPGK